MKPIKSSEITPESIYRQRRQIVKQLGFIGAGSLLSSAANAGIWDWFRGDDANNVFERARLSHQKNARFNHLINGALTPEQKILTHNNFYEFGTDKTDPSRNAQAFEVKPWQLRVEGEVDSPFTVDYDQLFQLAPLEERIYRFRCVEAWSMVIPWLGYPLASLLKRARPNSKAKYVAFETLYDPEQMPGQRNRFAGGGIDYPYVEGLRLDEAMNPLTLLSVGLYGKTLAPQNGAPIRLVVPWKYGFKSIKSIVRIRLTETMPPTTWNLLAANEYGFYANVNPLVAHPRWSQATERRIGEGGLLTAKRIKTDPFNGYGEYVASLYQNMDLHKDY